MYPFMITECVEERLNERDLEVLIYTTLQIQDRTSYGLRRELAQERGTVIIWSNAAKRWNISRPVEKGEEILLDANEIFVPASPARLARILGCLPPLPLYMLSFEAKQREGIDPYKQTLAWAQKLLERLRHEKFQERWK